MTEAVAAAQPLQWRVLEQASLSFRQLDDQHLVFNALTGDTHLLSLSGHELLQLMNGSGVAVPQAWSSADLSLALLGETDAQLQAQLTQNLSYLEQLGLIERQAS